MGKPKDKPKARFSPPEKGARTGEDPDDNNKKTPVWGIAVFDHEGPWGRELCDKDAAIWEEILPKLKSYESMTWGEIYKNKDYNHSVSVSNLIKKARDRLVTLNLDDQEQLFRFRLKGKSRVWGIRQGRVFLLLWWDPEHEICPSNKS